MKHPIGFFLTLFLFFLLQVTINGQGLYMRVNGGYALGTSQGNLLELSFINYTYEDDTETSELIDLSLGKGLEAGAALGYSFNRFLSAEIGFSYLKSAEWTSEMKDESGSPSDDQYSISSITQSLNSNMISLAPTIQISAGAEKVNPYARFGLVLGKAKVMQSREMYSRYKSEFWDFDEIESSEMEMERNGGWALGFSGGLGLDFRLSQNFSFFSELRVLSLSYAPKKGEVTKYEENGINELKDLTVSEKEVEYVDKIVISNDDDPIEEDEPSQDLKHYLPYNSLGLRLGLEIRF
jgi:opacity protein-like surface antigen